MQHSLIQTQINYSRKKKFIAKLIDIKKSWIFEISGELEIYNLTLRQNVR